MVIYTSYDWYESQVNRRSSERRECGFDLLRGYYYAFLITYITSLVRFIVIRQCAYLFRIEIIRVYIHIPYHI